MARHKVEIVSVNTADIKVLTSEEQTLLFKKMKEGDKQAKEALINGNLKLVLSLLKNFSGRCDMDDLFQVGCVGLIKAIDNFDLKHEVKFSTYAVPMIVGEVKRHLRDSSAIRVSRSLKDLAYKASKIREEMTRRNNKEPSISEIAKEMNVKEEDVANAFISAKDVISMYEPIYSDGGDVIYLEDQLNSDEGMYDKETKIALKKAIKNLKPKEKYVIIERYLIGKTQMELADEIGISQAQISRLEKSGLDNIKKMIS